MSSGKACEPMPPAAFRGRTRAVGTPCAFVHRIEVQRHHRRPPEVHHLIPSSTVHGLVCGRAQRDQESGLATANRSVYYSTHDL